MTFEQMAKMTQPALKAALAAELANMNFGPRAGDGFVYAAGKLPVLLVAHMDTVHDKPPETICRSDGGRIIMSPEGIGGDDRAGCYMALEVIKKRRCHVLFCEDEEAGAAGARKFVAGGIKPAVNFIVGLDRRGSDDAVFYGCDNPDFTKFVESFGFKKAEGSFSDISVIAPALGIAAANVSAGFYCEHTRHEYVDMDAVARNIGRVGEMAAAATGRFEYVESAAPGFMGFGPQYGHFPFSEARALMGLGIGHCVATEEGGLAECCGDHYIDRHGAVYEFRWDLGMAVEAGGTAMTENFMPARFREEEAEIIEVLRMGGAGGKGAA